MAFDAQQLKKALISKKIVTAASWDSLLAESKQKKEAIEELLVDKKLIEEEKLTVLEADLLDVDYKDLKDLGQIPKDVLFLVPEPIARRHKVIAFEKTKASCP